MANEILRDIKNDLLKRREIKIRILSESNPTLEEATKLIVADFKTQEDNIVMNTIKGKFGSKEFIIDVSIYDSKEAKEAAEPKPKKKEGAEGGASSDVPSEEGKAPAAEAPTAKEEPKAEAAEKPAAKEEAPKEEKKE